MKKINKVLLLSFFLIAVVLLSKALSPIDKDGFLGDTQKAAVFPAVTTPVNPISFWEFSGSTTTAQKTPTVGTQQFGGTETPTWTVGTGGKVGNYLANIVVGNTAGNLTPSANGWAVEFMLQPNKKFASGRIFSFGSNFSLEFSTPESGSGVPNNTPQMNVRINNTDNWIQLDGVGRKSVNYYADDNWHHFVVQYDPTSATEKIQVWVDGQLPTGFSFNQTVSTSGAVKFSSMNGGGFTYIDCDCNIDQVALYDKAIPPNLILQHKQNMDAGLAYATTTNITNVPTADSVVGTYDPLDFMAGMSLSNLSASGQNTGVTVSVVDQLKSYPLPRYKPGNTLIRNYEWMDITYMGNKGSTSISGGVVGNNTSTWAKTKEVNRQLATKWNYFLDVGSDGTDGFSLASHQLANDPALMSIPGKTTIIRLQQTVPGCSPYSCIAYSGHPNTHYLQNSSGQFLDSNGNVTTNKTWRPVSNYESSYAPDGAVRKAKLQTLLSYIPARVAAYPTKAIHMINENGEDHPNFSKSNADAVVNSDPMVLAAKNASGLDAYTYISRQFTRSNNAEYFDQLRSIPALADTTFTLYAQGGMENYQLKWTETRLSNDSINGQYYSAPDFYIRYPNNWRAWVSSWHGWAWYVASRHNELAAGDNLFSPFVAAGWNPDERQNVRPAQMLGFTKALAVGGAEFFYTGYFNIENPITNNGYPENWAWQATYPSYAQGITSYYEDILRTGKIMGGDTPVWDYGVDYSKPGFRFFTNNPSDLVMARKKDGANKFVIFGMENPWSNWDNVAPEESTVSINFGGNTVPATTAVPNENLKFKVRRQGSTYIYDKTGSSPVFYQLDAWQESSHPWYWSKDFSFEAEVYDTGTAGRTTTVPAGTPAGDYTTFTTYINPASGSTTYNFEPRDAASNSNKTYYIWALIKSATGSSSGQFKVDSQTAQNMTTSSQTFVWCKAANPATVVSNSAHTLTYTGLSSNFQVDKILLTTNASLNLGNCGGTLPTDTTPPTVSITAPANGASITTGPVNITATATDASGIASVEFKVNGTSIGIDTTSPYSASWSLTGVADGTHTIIATATDGAAPANVANTQITVTKNTPDTTGPTVPTDLSVSRSGNNAVLSWAASTDTGSGLAGYYVYRDGSTTALNTTALTGLGYTDTPTANTNHTYIVKAKDNAGNFSAASNQVSINIDTLGPTTTVTSPTSGSTISGTITMSATASDPSMIDHIDFYRGTTIVCSAPGNNQTSGTFSCSWNTTAVANGSYQISAKSYDKVTPSSNSTTTTAFSVTVSNVVTPPADTTAPTVSVTAPTGGSTISGTTTTVSANASDNVGVTTVQFFTDSATTPFATDSTAPYSVTLNTTSLTNGAHTIKAKAFDAAGNSTTSANVSVTVSNVVGMPDVIVTDISWSPASPAVGSNVVFTASVKNQGTASTPSGTIVGVAFSVDGVMISCADGHTTSIAPGATVNLNMGTGAWCGSNAATSWNATTGDHTITATVDDTNRFAESNEANNTTTEALAVVTDTTAPVVSVTGPTSGTVIAGGTTATIGITATDSSGIQNVKVYIDGVQYGSNLTTAPYTVSWNTTGFATGTHSITAIATDNAGNSATSAAVTVSITNPVTDTTAPTVTFTCPNNNCNVSNGEIVPFTTNATDNVAVTRVEFFHKSTLKCTLTSPTTPPSTYSCGIQIGGWSSSWFKQKITVKAYDAAGNVTTKSISVY